jgi:hypothetical protein
MRSAHLAWNCVGENDQQAAFFQYIVAGVRAVQHCDFLICNSFQDAEPVADGWAGRIKINWEPKKLARARAGGRASSFWWMASPTRFGRSLRFRTKVVKPRGLAERRINTARAGAGYSGKPHHPASSRMTQPRRSGARVRAASSLDTS